MSPRPPPPAPQSGSGQLLLRMRTQQFYLPIRLENIVKYVIRILGRKGTSTTNTILYLSSVGKLSVGHLLPVSLLVTYWLHSTSIHIYYVQYMYSEMSFHLFFFFSKSAPKTVWNKPAQQLHIISEMLIWELGVYQVQVHYSRTNKSTGWRETC